MAEFVSGNRYEGEWDNDFKHGKGTITFVDGTTYVGVLSSIFPSTFHLIWSFYTFVLAKVWQRWKNINLRNRTVPRTKRMCSTPKEIFGDIWRAIIDHTPTQLATQTVSISIMAASFGECKLTTSPCP